MIPDRLSSEQLEKLLATPTDFIEDIRSAHEMPVLQVLTSLDSKQLNHLMSEVHCKPGEVLIREGESGEALYMIWSGRVVVFKGDLESPSILGFRGAGEIIGEMALLENRPRFATIVAIEETRMLRLSLGAFHELLKENPLIGLNIMKALSARLRASDQARSRVRSSENRLIKQLDNLQTEKQHLLDLQALQQSTGDLIVHDLRNPLGSVSLALKMLEMVLPEEIFQENRQLLDIAKSSTYRMLCLVDSYLDVSQIEAGEADLIFSEIDLRDLITEEMGNILIHQARSIHLQANIPNDLPHIRADREKIVRVLTNLFDNALKYTPDGGQILVAAVVKDDQVHISVEDTGPGILERDRQRIFERFVRTDNVKSVRRGFGLGLAYCRLAVEAHKGSIWVEAGEGGIGSRFVFTLPLNQN
jgi:signal transduction histidine kinase